MQSNRLNFTIGIVLGIMAGFLMMQGCGKITGDFNTNQLPTVEIVNVPGDAWGVDTTHHYAMPFEISAFGQPTVILSMSGTEMVANSETVYYLDSAGTHTFARDVVYTMDYAGGTLTALADGGMELGTEYLIDFSFLVDNYYVFSYAPQVHWVGYDADGFVDHYSYADVTDTAFISAFRAAADPQLFIRQNEGSFVWYDTTAMEARIYLLTEAGNTTEHIFLVKATDNLGAESQNIAFKTFYRSNNPPNNPQIKPIEAPDAALTQDYVLADTLFCLDSLTGQWQGISFNWMSNDPDDKELYLIPLEFSYYLVKAPGDTIWSWSDSSWSETQQIQLFGLETGSYAFSVWVRDDAYTLCQQPATISFKVIRPTFEHHILMVDETTDQGPYEIVGDSVIDNFWLTLLQNLEGELDNDNYALDGVDVYFKDNSNNNDATIQANPLPYALIGQYQLVIIYNDDHTTANFTYIANRDSVLMDYLDVGGNLWIEGRRILSGWYSGNTNVVVDISSTSLMGQYLQIESGYRAFQATPTQSGEFRGAIPVLLGLPELTVDSTKVAALSNLNPLVNRTRLPEIDYYTTGDQAVTLYAFNSVTADTIATSPYAYDEDSEVADFATPTQCTIRPLHEGILAVYRVYNATLGMEAEINNFNSTEIFVSYPYGQPWLDSDSLEVDYKYDPVSDLHLKPVALRFENQPRITNTFDYRGFTITYYTYTLGYRTALFGFPLYFMDDPAAAQAVVKDMLNWFFYPTLHWSI